MLAAEEGHLSAVAMLLDRGANIESASKTVSGISTIAM